MSEPNSVLEAIRRQAGGRIDTPPPIEVPSDRIPSQDPGRSKKRTIEIEDDLSDALRVVNSHFEAILEGDLEIPDSAVPELQKMGELQVMLVEAAAPPPQQGGPAQGGQVGPALPPQQGPGNVEDLPLL